MNPTSDRSMSSGEKGRYKCEDCHQVFAVEGELAIHKMIHSGEQPHSKRAFSCPKCGRSFWKQAKLDQHHLKYHEKPSSPLIWAPKMKAKTPVPPQKSILKMVHDLLNKHQENQKSAWNAHLREQQEKILNTNHNTYIVNERNENGGVGGFKVPAPAMPLNLYCILCNSQFINQSSFDIHMHMYHSVNQNTNLSYHQATSIGNQNAPNPLGFVSDPAIDTSCAPNLQEKSLLQLLESSCFGQNSVSPWSASEVSHQPTASESTSTTSSCNDCTISWLRVHDLEQEMLEKDEDFKNHKQKIREIISNVISNFLTTSATPENVNMIKAANVLTRLKNRL